MIARDQVKAAWGDGAAIPGSSNGAPRRRPSAFSDAPPAPQPPAPEGGERADLQSNIDAMRRIAAAAASVSAKAASAAGVQVGAGRTSGNGWDAPPPHAGSGPGLGSSGGGGGAGGDLGSGGVEAAHSFDLRFEGKIIGRAGSKINELQQTHGVRLQVEKGAGRLLMLGAPDAIARCVAEVEALCRDDQTEGWIVETVQIGERNEGRVIGAGGCVIRDLEARTGCSVRVQKGEGTCTIGGTDQQKVAAAKAEVYKVCEAAGTPVNGFAANADNVVERVSVYRRGGLVVGPQGVNIRRIKDESGAHVQVMRETEEAVVTGSREKAAAAVAMIGEILATMPYRPHEMHGAPPEAQARYAAQAPDGGGGAGGANGSAAAAVGASFGADATETVPCPFNAGAIIGARGATIREISEKTGARLVVKGNEAVTGGERVKGTEFVEIRGDPRAVAAAVAEVNRILEEKRATSYRAPPPLAHPGTGGYHDASAAAYGAAAYGAPPPYGAMPPVYGTVPPPPFGMVPPPGPAGGAWGHDPFAGARAAAAAHEVPPPPIPPPAPAPPVAGGDAGYVPSADEVGAPPPPPPAPPA